MMFIKHIERFEKIDKLIRTRRTGTPDEFADRVGISRRQLYNYLDELRSYGVEISYSRVYYSFQYSNNKKLRVYFDCEEIERSKVNQVAGGYCIFAPNSFSFSIISFGTAV
jgi:predicted DNA-binding transcriptional regulator YafY